MKLTFCVHSSVSPGISIDLCNHHKLPHHPKYPRAIPAPAPPAPTPTLATGTLFCTYSLVFSGMVHALGSLGTGFFYLAWLWGSPRCLAWSSSFLLLCWVVFRGMLGYPLTRGGHLGCWWVELLCTLVYRTLYGRQCLFPWDKYTAVALRGHTAVTLYEIIKLFFSKALRKRAFVINEKVGNEVDYTA